MAEKHFSTRLLPLAFCVLAANVGAQTLGFSGPSEVKQGETFTEDVIDMEINNLYAFQFDVLFTPGTLHALSSTQGTLMAGSGEFLSGNVDDANGAITFIGDALSGPVAGITATGSLTHITFTAVRSGVVDFRLANVVLLDSSLNDIAPVAVVPGRLTITPAVPEPSTWFSMLAGLGVLWARSKTSKEARGKGFFTVETLRRRC